MSYFRHVDDTVIFIHPAEKLRAAKYDYPGSLLDKERKKRRNYSAVLFNQKRCFIKQLLRIYEHNSIILWWH